MNHEDAKYLFHYTDQAALRGMLNSNEIWATHIRHMNDATEFRHAKGWLTQILEREIYSWLKVRGTIANEISPQASALAKYAIEAFYKNISDEFYVVSFSDHRHSFDSENGLLSQFQRYGEYMLVFDLEKMRTIASEETGRFAFVDCHLSDVIYEHDQTKTPDAAFGEQIDILLPYFEKLIFDTGALPAHDAATAFANIASRFKNRGFHQELEKRLVFARVDPSDSKFAPYGTPPPEKPKLHRVRVGRDVPYVKLFGEGFSQLPIERIVVVPNKNSREMVHEARAIVGPRGIKVCVSETPLVD